jgi:hypothetical protein
MGESAKVRIDLRIQPSLGPGVTVAEPEKKIGDSAPVRGRAGCSLGH